MFKLNIYVSRILGTHHFSISGWVFLVAISLGAVAGLKLFRGSSCLVPPRHRDKNDFK